MKISIIGAGYVGLVTGLCFADKSCQVICVDNDEGKVKKINQGKAPIHEADLEELLRKHINVNLYATTDLFKSVLETDLTFVAVGTPFDGNEIDLSFVKKVSKQIGKALKKKNTYHLVVIKSTVIPGTTSKTVLQILEKSSGKIAGVDFGLGMNPEFLTEGQAIQDFMFPDRIVLGGIDEKSISLLQELYSSFNCPKIITNPITAEMIKYVSNCMLAIQISFSNEIANLCSALDDVDVIDVMNGLHSSYYLSPVTPNGDRIQAPITSFLEAGCGFGGSCLPKDVKAIVSFGEKVGTSMSLLRAVIEKNQQQSDQIIKLLKKHFPSLENVRIAILGLSFKPNTDDMRESPAIPIIKELLLQRAVLKAYDPVANHAARGLFSKNQLALSEALEESLRDVDAVVLVTRWEQFRAVPRLLAKVNPRVLFVDGRRMLDKRLFAHYEGIGL